MRIITLISFCIIFFISSCKKEDQNHYPVIYPGSYYPVYPNTWWKYINEDSVITTDSVGPAYQLNTYITWTGDNKDEYSDPFYVPFLNGQPIYHYDKIVYEIYPYAGERWPILSEKIGFEFQRDYHDPRFTYVVEMVTVKRKYFNGTDSVLVQEGHWTHEVNDFITTQEFVKNVGLVSQITWDTITHDTIYKKILLDYYISFDTTSIDY
jgi:hypothetical protein